ncbi:hypothetical protein HID58_065338, partial [Brassica napus]
RSTIRSVLTASRPSFLLFSVRRSILTASRPSSFLFSVKRSIETHLSLTLSHTTILFCSPVLASTAPFTSISDQSTVNAFRNLKFLGKSSVQVPYSGEDESRVLKRVKGSFSDQENTVVCVLDNFDDIVDSHACLFLQSLWPYGFHFLFYLFSAVTGMIQNIAFISMSYIFFSVRMCTYLLLVYGPVRSHLGFPAWRLRYTEI